jgi:rRNA-processing protein FCF1
VTVNLGPHRIALADVRVVAHIDRVDGVVDVAVHHPVLAELDEAGRSALTFLPLDATLGERLAAERLRRVETAVAEPDGTLGLLEFRDLVRELASLQP